MRKIYLTINIDATDPCFDQMSDITKINLGDIIKAQRILLKPGELEEIRGQIVADYMLKSEENVLIGFGILSQVDLMTVLNALGQVSGMVIQLFADNGTRKEAAIETYKTDYAPHSRWLDYSPEYVEHAYLEFDKKIEVIEQYSLEQGIEFIRC